MRDEPNVAPIRTAPASSANDSEIADLLSRIDPDCGYDDWRTALMAVHSATGGSPTGLAIADAWSARGKKYKPGEVAAKWRGFDPSGPVTVATLADMARQNGANLSAIARKHGKAGGNGDAAHGARIAEQLMAPRKADEPAPSPIRATPFLLPDPATIPARDFLYGRHLIRGFLSTTVAPGGVGKSGLVTVEALAMVTGRDLLGQEVRRPLRVWLWNLEDPADELTRRFAAACQHYGINADDIENRLFVDSGRVQRLCMAVQEKNGAKIIRPVVDAVRAEMAAKKIDVLIVDPFVSSHSVSENDNGAMDLVAKEWADVADKCGAAIELVHHTRKLSGDVEVTAESSRGAKALTDAARDVRAINRMTGDEATKAGVDNHRLFFRIYSDKGNLAPPADKSQWHKLENVELANGDHVGVVTPWAWPDPFDGLTTHDLLAVQEAVNGKNYRENVQAKDWIGYAIGGVLGLDCGDPQERAKVRAILKTWIANGALKVRKMTDERGKDRPVIEVGEWAT